MPTLLMFKDNHVSEYMQSYDYTTLSDYLNFRYYDDEQLTERFPIPSAAVNQHVKPK